MANQNTIADLSTTPASNLNFKGQSIRGTAVANTIDTMFQNEASMLKAFYESLGGVATVSGTDTYTVTITEDWAAYGSGLWLAIKPANANTGAATLNVTVPTAGALGAKAIRRQGDSALQANDMVANGVYLLRYSTSYNSSAGAWVLLNPAASSVSLPITEANGGTNQTTYTQGDLLYASAANTLSKLAKGTANQNLEMNSGATVPNWAAPVGLKLLTSGTVSSAATLDIVLSSYTSYRGFRIVLSGFQPATDGTDLYLRFSTNGGSSYDTTTYSYSGQRIDTGGTSGAFSSGSAGQISLVGGANAANGSNAQIISNVELQNPFSASLFTLVTFQNVSYGNNSSRPNYAIFGQGSHSVAQDTDAIRFLFSSGNIAAGNYAVYGYV